MSNEIMDFIYENAVFPIMQLREMYDTTENRLAILTGMLERETPVFVQTPMQISIINAIVAEINDLRSTLVTR